MNKVYLKRIQSLLKLTRPRLASTRDLEFKNVFGAVGGYVNGHLFVSCGKFGVAFKLPQPTLEKLFQEKNVRPLKYFPKGHVKKDYAVLPNRILSDTAAIKKLVDKSIAHVLLHRA